MSAAGRGQSVLSFGAFIQDVVPDSLYEAFGRGRLPVEEPPAKRRRTSVTTTWVGSIGSELDSEAAHLAQLKEYYAATRLSVQLMFAGSRGDDDSVDWIVGDDGLDLRIPVTTVKRSWKGAGTDRAIVTLETKTHGRRTPLFSRLIDVSEDLPFRVLQVVHSAYVPHHNKSWHLLHEASLRRSRENDYTYILDATIYVRNTTVITKLPSHVSELLDRSFPAQDESLANQSFAPSHFYANVHVPPRDVTPSVHSPLVRCQLFPFQRRAVRWLMRREGATLHTNSSVTPAPSHAEPTLPPSFFETVDALGKICLASPYLHVLTSDTSDCWNADATVKGGILAEEMGLGKTVEIITLIALHTRDLDRSYPHHSLTANDGRPLVMSGATLIIAPVAILRQWESEFAKHAPDLAVFVYRGIAHHEGSHELAFVESMAGFDVVLTTYDVLSGELHYSTEPPDRNLRHKKKNPLRRSPLVQISWWRVCLDEAQMVESGVTQCARVARLIPRVNAWAVTGTPLRKDLHDLYGLLLFLHYEPFCYTPDLWRRLCEKYMPLFKDIIGKIALRHSKDQVRDELAIPPQKRFVIKVPFTAIEEHKYSHQFQQMCDDCGLTRDGAPARDDWDPDDAGLVEKMRRWLTRLRKTCLYAELSRDMHKTLARVSDPDVPLRSVADVLESMIEATGIEMFSCLKQLHLSMIQRGQLLENALQVTQAMTIWEETLASTESAENSCRAQYKIEADKYSAMTVRKAKTGKGTAGKPGVHDSEDDESSDSDDQDDKDGRKQAQRKRMTSAGARLRTVLEIQHSCYFFIGNALYQMRTELSDADADSEHSRDLERRESAAYEKAKQIRKEILQAPMQDASRHIASLRATLEDNGLVTFPKMELDLQHAFGFESQRLADRIDYFCEHMNKQALLFAQRRKHLADMLLARLVDQDNDNAELEGNEYEESAKVQEQLHVYMEIVQYMAATRAQDITGQPNELVLRQIAQARAQAKEGEGPAPALFLELLAHCSVQVETDSLRAIVTDLRQTMTELQWRATAERSSRASAELLLLRPLLEQVTRINAVQTKANVAAEAELRVFRRVMNKRLDYYRQLQQISDTVAPFEEEAKGQPLNRQRYEETLRSEEATKSQISSLTSKHRYLIYLRDESGEDDDNARLCVICQSTIEVGVLTVCGHKYCRECFTLWWSAHRNCPTCKRKLSANDSHPISYKPIEMVAQEEQAPDPRGSDSDEPGNPIYANVSKGVLSEVLSTQLGHEFGTKIDTIAKHLIWLRQHDPGAKSVVFSQYSSFTYRLEHAFKLFGIGCVRLDGAGVKRFNEDPSIECILIHCKSQASGLNLTNATHIFLCEPLINTAMELQAIARIHRIGQRRETTVWMYIISDTVEESIYDISVRRRLEHIARRARPGFLNALPSGPDSRPALTDDMLDAANSLQVRMPVAFGHWKQHDLVEGEVVPKDDLWQCLFAKPHRASRLSTRQANGEADREVRALAAEGRRAAVR